MPSGQRSLSSMPLNIASAMECVSISLSLRMDRGLGAIFLWKGCLLLIEYRKINVDRHEAVSKIRVIRVNRNRNEPPIF